MFPKNKNIRFKYNSESEFNDFKKFILKNIKSKKLESMKYTCDDEYCYIFYDDDDICKWDFHYNKLNKPNIPYIDIQCYDFINHIRKQKLEKILK